MQIYVQDLLDINFSSSMCYDTVSTYDTSILSLLLNSAATSAFCKHEMHDTTYDISIISIVGSLMIGGRQAAFRFLILI
jgi:hypothetical protein